MPTKQRLTKQDITQAHIIDSTKEHNPLLDYLAKHHPQTISEERLNLDALSQALGFSPSSMQGYGLSFIGKPLANALYSTPTTKELKELDPKHSQNIIIKGDNLHALKLLKSAYDGKIKMIYIDPPYNTKNEKFIYDDNFVKEYQKLLVELDLLKLDSNGKVLEKSEVLHFLTNPSGDKAHSAWLAFMLPRLKLARDLLKDDGVIFISIDDNEQANLKILCDEIFGEENFVGDFIRKTKSTTNDAKTGLNYQHEFLLCYAKDRASVNLLGGEKDLSKYQNPDNDPNGAWVSSDPTAKSGDMKTGYFAVENPYTGKVDYPTNGRFWRFSQNTMQKHIDEGHICFKKEHKDNERGFIYKRYLKDLQTNLRTFDSLKFTDNKFMNQAATKELLALGLGEYFTYPKSVDFIKEITKHATNTGGGGGGDIVVYFFAGSGTTAQAVMELNAEDGGNRKFILVQLDESIDEAKSKVAYDFCKNTLKSQNPVISDITIERVKRAAAKIAKAAKQDLLSTKELDLDFRLFTMVQKPELVSEENDNLGLITHADLSPQDKALNLALQDSKMLHKKLESIIKDKLYQCENSLYIVQMDKEVLDYIKNKTHDEIVYLNAFDDIDLQEYLNLESHLKTRLYVVFQ
ncbi:site-specific DNA-methyltransferase [Campylobacter upsaliensis]|uniref:site-specific DNA-methyltransferase n=1 Tax=Campylobacter upsaliensis TaxID=28080 RepID=UPI002B3A5306|nr:site-specific DNA-methyltransferase [Campylobacter upsaliensis]MEB2789372.1 site-specific DNA-methyltransferase [Campylobacter upsaliensis]